MEIKLLTTVYYLIETSMIISHIFFSWIWEAGDVFF